MTKLTEDEIKTKQAYDASVAGWSDYFDNTGGWPIELEKFHKYLPQGEILEVGAGTGRDAHDLINLGYKYTGTDISDKLLAVARQKLPQQKFIPMSVYDLEFPNKFDGFWASAVLLHIPKKNIDKALQKIKSTQKNEAIGFISIKDGKGEGITTKTINGQELKRFFSFWKREDFERVLSRNGYEVLDYNYRIVSADTYWHMFIVQIV